MNASFRELAPAAAAQVEAVSQIPLIRQINEAVWIFAVVETAHLMFLAVLGGAVFALNLRVLGVALQEIAAKDVERATRPWLVAGIVGTVGTGVTMGLTTATMLMTSVAFFVKMVALIAAILFSVAVARGVRRGEVGTAGAGPHVLAGLALLIWVASLLAFATRTGLGSGAFLIALAGFIVFTAVAQRHRLAYVIGLTVVLGGGLIASAALGDDNLGLASIAAALVLAAVVGTLEFRGRAGRKLAGGRLTAFASILSWVTVAAAGRWIGFS